VHLIDTKTSNILDIISTVVLFNLNTVRHVKYLTKMRFLGMCHVWGRNDADWVWWKNLRDRDLTEDQSVEGIIILKWILRKEFGRPRT
jgi:hypothetical protein